MIYQNSLHFNKKLGLESKHQQLTTLKRIKTIVTHHIFYKRKNNLNQKKILLTDKFFGISRWVGSFVALKLAVITIAYSITVSIMEKVERFFKEFF